VAFAAGPSLAADTAAVVAPQFIAADKDELVTMDK
jgi:hypothetical protein